MSGAGGVSGSNISALLQNQPLDSFFLSGSSPSFLGSRSMVSFEDVNHGNNGSARSFFRSFDQDDLAEDDLDEYLQQPGKKRRLTVNQVQFLERSFEVENKLEPERKVQLAKDIGLQPRQVAIWFQNRRARWKTKQLEKDYEVLLASYDTLKADFDGLLVEKENLKAEVDLLKNKLDVNNSNGSSELSDTEKNSVELPKTSAVDSASEAEVSKASIGASKQEDISSAKSGIIDSDSLHYADRVRSSLLETGDQSDLSQDEDDNLTMSLLHTPCFLPKLEHSAYSEPPASFEDNSFWSWSY